MWGAAAAAREGQRVCHMFCDTTPHGPPPAFCRNVNVPDDEGCPRPEWLPRWQPWPAGGALQT